jgi:hypothetical protein
MAKQVELPDQWLSNGFVFEVRKPKHAVEVKFYGNAETYLKPDGSYGHTHGQRPTCVRAVPYDVSSPATAMASPIAPAMVGRAERKTTFRPIAFDEYLRPSRNSPSAYTPMIRPNTAGCYGSASSISWSRRAYRAACAARSADWHPRISRMPTSSSSMIPTRFSRFRNDASSHG